jgi:serine/threonine protein kinase
MPSESVAGFLDHAKASRVLFPEQVDQLIGQPDMPQSDLNSLCEFLQSRGVLTRFQATAIREHRGAELNYAGYPLVDEVGPCPGGTAYRALHPSLRTPILLRRIRSEWLAPIDNVTNYTARARAFGMIPHPNLVPLLDVGVNGDEIYMVLDLPLDVADLETLAKEIGGAMPGFLAAEYGRAVASGLRAAHDRGGAHGDVCPSNLIIGPLATRTNSQGKLRRRPAPDAVLRLAELGLVPIRLPAAENPTALTPYTAPERLDAPTQTPRGDLYSLGATLYFLLAGRSPFPADDPDLLNKIRTATPTSLTTLRPDLAPEFVELVGKLMQKNPEQRPGTIHEVEAALSAFCRPGVPPPNSVVIPTAVPTSMVGLGHHGPQPAPVLVPVPHEQPHSEAAGTPDSMDEWGVAPSAFDQAHADAQATPVRKRQMTDKERGRGKALMILGGVLHLTAIAMLVMWMAGVFDSIGSSDDPDPTPKATKKGGGDRPQKKSRAI